MNLRKHQKKLGRKYHVVSFFQILCFLRESFERSKDHLETWTNGLEGLPTNHTIIVPRSHSEGSFLAFHVLERLQDSFF